MSLDASSDAETSPLPSKRKATADFDASPHTSKRPHIDQEQQSPVAGASTGTSQQGGTRYWMVQWFVLCSDVLGGLFRVTYRSGGYSGGNRRPRSTRPGMVHAFLDPLMHPQLILILPVGDGVLIVRGSNVELQNLDRQRWVSAMFTH